MLKRVTLWFVSALQASRRLLGLTRDDKRRTGSTGSKRRRGLRESSTPDEKLAFVRSPPIDPARAKIDSAVVDFDSRAIIEMERRALRQIFDHLDLPLVPGWAFSALEQTRDPVMAFKLFATWVGVDPIAARDRADAAISRMELAIDLLRELIPLRSLLTDDGDKRICDALRDSTGPGSLSRLHDQKEQVAAAATLHRMGSRIEELPSCNFASRLREIINEVTADPLSTTKPDMEEGIETGERLEKALLGLKTLEKDVADDLQLLHEAYLAGTLSDEHAVWCNEQSDAFEHLLDEIVNDASLGAIEEHVKQGEAIRDSLLTMRGYGAGARRTGPRTPIEEVDEALTALGLARSPTLNWREIERHIRNLWRKHSTDDPKNRATPEQHRANTERMQEINTARDILKKYKDKLADMMADMVA
jgi:hypothetical protein